MAEPPDSRVHPPPALLFQHPSRKVARAPLHQFLGEIATKVAGGRGITCLITGDAHLQALNNQFCSKDFPTDVLSFPLQEGGGGEIAVSFDAAARQAAEFGHSVEDELRILILHGVLHLTGLDHETDAGEMARAEAGWRKRLGLPRTLIERSQRPRRKQATA